MKMNLIRELTNRFEAAAQHQKRNSRENCKKITHEEKREVMSLLHGS